MNVSEDLLIKRGPTLIALEWLAIASSVVVAAGLAYVVAARYYLNWPAAGVHTIVMVAAIWLYMTGALIASQSRQHLVVDYLSHRLKTPPTGACYPSFHRVRTGADHCGGFCLLDLAHVHVGFPVLDHDGRTGNSCLGAASRYWSERRR